MATNITENQLISMVEGQGDLEFLNPRYALPSRYYITFLPLSSCQYAH